MMVFTPSNSFSAAAAASSASSSSSSSSARPAPRFSSFSSTCGGSAEDSSRKCRRQPPSPVLGASRRGSAKAPAHRRLSSQTWFFLLSSLLAVSLVSVRAGCSHEDGDDVEAPSESDGEVFESKYVMLKEGSPLSSTVSLGKHKMFLYENSNATTMGQQDRYRKLIISLEPCNGVVYLFGRKTRRCWPDPPTCCKPLTGAYSEGPPPCNNETHTVQCTWSHFHSIIDGTRDGSPTFFEIPHNSVKYFFSVYAPSEVNLDAGVTLPTFRITVLADIGAYPRPGLGGQLRAVAEEDERAFTVSWDAATFIPSTVSSIKNYYLYSSLLLTSDKKVSESVFLTPAKVMNSVCGLERNAVKYGNGVTSASCTDGVCSAKIAGILPDRRYMLNIVAESYRGFNSTYSGIIVSSDWKQTRHAFSDWSDTTTSLVGAICGTVFGVLVIGYLWIVKLYK